MKFGLFYELQVPRPWDEDTDRRLIAEVMEQVELADRLGFDCIWAVEHHFLEEYSHCSAPEVLLGALAARTDNIRLGHGIANILPPFNHPARVAERVATLDLISGGRVELGTGEGTTNMELGGFGVDRGEKRALWEEVVAELPRLFTEEPYAGHDGPAFRMPVRNVMPKPMQKPHPPLWVACTHRESITTAARKGIGALTFSFIDADQAREHVEHYHRTLADEGVAIGPSVNPNIAVVTGMMCDHDEQRAIDRGIDGVHYFAYSIAHYAVFGDHRPGRTNLYEEFEQRRDAMGMSRAPIVADGRPLTVRQSSPEEAAIEDAGGLERGSLSSLRGAIGTPEQIREFLRGYEEAGVDQMIFHGQAGTMRHEHICESLELFAEEVMPEFKERDAQRTAEKERRLAPVVEQVLARRGDDARTAPDVLVTARHGEPEVVLGTEAPA